MDYIRKIPLLLGTGAGLVIGLIGLSAGVPNKDNMLNMCVGMVVFYIVGILARSTIRAVSEHITAIIRKKKKRRNGRRKRAGWKPRKQGRASGASIDMTVGDEIGLEDNDFEDLHIAEFIKNEMK